MSCNTMNIAASSMKQTYAYVSYNPCLLVHNTYM